MHITMPPGLTHPIALYCFVPLSFFNIQPRTHTLSRPVPGFADEAEHAAAAAREKGLLEERLRDLERALDRREQVAVTTPHGAVPLPESPPPPPVHAHNIVPLS